MARKANIGPPGEMKGAGTDHAGRRLLEVAGELVSVSCSWNDHGNTCREYGPQSDSTNGMGPWYCKHHWRELHGRNV